MSDVKITRFCKVGGPLTKRIALAADGTIASDGSACTMSAGTAERVSIADPGQLAQLINIMASNEAIALGMLRADLADKVQVTTKDKINGATPPDIIARTAGNLVYRPGQTAFALLDYDTKGMPPAVADQLTGLGGYWAALVSVLPAVGTAARVSRSSTSAGLFRADTGERLPGSGGRHDYVLVKDGADIPRFLKTMHDRCWLAGFGWMMVGAGGQLLERSIVDRMVGTSERLVFEGAPTLEPPLEQDQEIRRASFSDGEALDTAATCPPLTVLELANLRALRAKETYRLAAESARVRSAFVTQQSRRLAARTGMSVQDAERAIAHQCDELLLPGVELPFDDEKLGGTTVGDVLADPDRFEGETLADPLEGVAYGRCVAKIMRRANGSPWIHSFAHGRTVYELKFDARAVQAALEKVADGEAVKTLVKLDLIAELDEGEWEELRNLAARRNGINKRTIDVQRKAARQKQVALRAEEDRNRRLAERSDPRPQVSVPATDAPWIPQMDTINGVLGKSSEPIPPMRDIDGFVTKMRKRHVPNMHAFSTQGANSIQEEDDHAKLPAPEQLLLSRLDEAQCAELIEQHIDFVDAGGRSVHLPMQFVRHYMKRDDEALPTVVATATLPIVLADEIVLSSDGLDRLRGIVFNVPKELQTVMPAREDCTPEAVAQAMKFLCDDWLCDVATDYAGKCIMVSAALTLVERSLLPDRPVFFVTAGRRGGGKTTTLTMLIMAVTGVRPAAAAWSPNEEERRKALLGYFLEGVAYIIWDNIPRGIQISCPHIEKSCTAAYYSDRRLGFSETVATAASTIQFFTGNNIGPKGDLASRSLNVRLEVNRVDPENREFTHPDPVGWTEANRAKILRALYTVLLGNPMLAKAANAAAKTRFKMWWRLIGSAIEHGAMQTGHELDFKKLFLEQEGEDEESASLADALDIMATHLPKSFKAADVANLVNNSGNGANLREILYPGVPATLIATAKSVGKRLRRHIGEPVKHGERTLSLLEWREAHDGARGALSYYVKITE